MVSTAIISGSLASTTLHGTAELEEIHSRRLDDDLAGIADDEVHAITRVDSELLANLQRNRDLSLTLEPSKNDITTPFVFVKHAGSRRNQRR